MEAARQILEAEVPFRTSLGPGVVRQDLGVMEEFPTLLEIFKTHLFLSGDSSSDFMLVFSRQQNGKETQLTFFSMRNECPANMMRDQVDENLRCHISIVITHTSFQFLPRQMICIS